MPRDLMRYDMMVEDALRGVVRNALRHVARDGLPGNHHFYLTFRTDAEGVEMADYLRERYPVEMTIVLQYQFYSLEIEDERFSVTLSFNNMPERLVIPFEAISIFADPSVNFALQFQAVNDSLPEAVEGEPVRSQGEGASDDAPAEPTGPAEIVSLDAFRKK